MKETTYDEDKQIDPLALDEEWVKQVQLYDKWGTQKAHAAAAKVQAEEALKLARSEAKKRLDEKRAELDFAIREFPANYGFTEKPKETAISSAIILDTGYKELDIEGIAKVKAAVDDYVAAIDAEETFEVARMTMNHRRAALEYLTQLYISSYYVGDIPKEGKKLVGEKAKEAHEDFIDKKLRRRQSGG